jgi:hypothetical protein
MEILISGLQSQEAEIFPEAPARELYLCHAESVGDLPEEIQASSSNFGLLLALDAKALNDQEILGAAEKLVEKGLVVLCAWGPDCERVHDLFDKAARKKNDALSGGDVIMTTWHSRETLTEVMWFFIHAAFPTQSFEPNCADWIIAPIGNRDWEEEVRTKIREVAFIPHSE